MASSFLRKGQSQFLSGFGLAFQIPNSLWVPQFQVSGEGGRWGRWNDFFLFVVGPAFTSVFFFLNRSGAGGSKHYCPGSSFRLQGIPPLSTLAEAQLTCLHPVKFRVLPLACIQTHQSSRTMGSSLWKSVQAFLVSTVP